MHKLFVQLYKNTTTTKNNVDTDIVFCCRDYTSQVGQRSDVKAKFDNIIWLHDVILTLCANFTSSSRSCF